MKRRSLIVVLTLLVVFMTACSAASETEQASAPANSTAPVLEIVGLEESKSLSMADLQAMQTTAGWGGTISSTGVISLPQQSKGVTVLALAWRGILSGVLMMWDCGISEFGLSSSWLTIPKPSRCWFTSGFTALV